MRLCGGMPYPSGLVSGREVCRPALSRVFTVRDAPSLLYRSDLVRSQIRSTRVNLHATWSHALYCQNCDYWFCPSDLTFRGCGRASIGKFTEEITPLIAGRLHDLVVHGS